MTISLADTPSCGAVLTNHKQRFDTLRRALPFVCSQNELRTNRPEC